MAVGLNITPLKRKASPFKLFLPAAAAVAGATGNLDKFGIDPSAGGGLTFKGRSATDYIFGLNKGPSAAELEAQRGLTGAIEDFKGLSTENIYADVENPYAGIKNPYADIQTEFENVYEDATVNQQQAQFEREQARQSQANLLDQMRQAGGGAGMAQIIQQQMTTDAARTSASIGQQEAALQQQAMRGAADVQRMEQEAKMTRAKGAYDVDVLGRQGELQAQQMRLGGEEASRQLQYQKQQGLMSLYAGQKQAAIEEEESKKGLVQKVMGGIFGG